MLTNWLRLLIDRQRIHHLGWHLPSFTSTASSYPFFVPLWYPVFDAAQQLKSADTAAMCMWCRHIWGGTPKIREHEESYNGTRFPCHFRVVLYSECLLGSLDIFLKAAHGKDWWLIHQGLWLTTEVPGQLEIRDIAGLIKVQIRNVKLENPSWSMRET